MLKSLCQKRSLAILTFALALFQLIGQATAQSSSVDGSANTVMDTIATELLSTIDQRKTAYERWLRKFEALVKPRQVALWPFKDSNIPIQASLVDGWNENLLDALIRRSPPYLRFISKADLAKVISNEKSFEFGQTDNTAINRILKNAKVEILIIGKVAPADGGVLISYKAVDNDGGILGTSCRHFVRVKNDGGHAASLNLDRAVEVATGELANVGNDLLVIRLGSILEATGKVQTEFGRLFLRKVSDALSKKLSNEATGSFIAIDDAELRKPDVKSIGKETTSREKTKFRGLDVVVKEKLAGTAKGAYLLEGEYWDYESYIEVRLSLLKADKSGPIWNGRISRKSVPPGIFKKPEEGPWGKDNGYGSGPLGLELNSTKGRNPVYKIGQKMILMVRSSQDVFLNCFYRDAKGTTFKFFPNKHYPNSKIPGKVLLEVPNERMPFEFKMVPPVGNEHIICFATDKSIAHRLPPMIGERDLEPIPERLSNRLEEIFNKIPAVKISQSTMNITVEQ